jgi:hypothetical protein
VVDVGGGVGHLCLAIGSEAPQLKFVVQDREEVAKSAPEVSRFLLGNLRFDLTIYLSS